jgi:hypothetical protein
MTPQRPLSVLLATALLVIGAPRAHAVPNTVSFTARVTDAAGGPVTGPLTVRVALYDGPTAGTMLWEETHRDVPVADGLVYASLGAVDPINNGLGGTVFDGRPIYAELTVNGDVLSPRIPIESVPYAVRSAVADKLQGFDPSAVQHRVTGTCPAGNYITAVAPDGSVTCAADVVGIGGIAELVAGGGLTGGGTTGAVSLAVDTSLIQSRVTGTCAAGQYITAIAANGAVTCAADAVGSGDITGVTAGGGLTGGGTTGAVSLAVDTSVIQSRVTGTCATGQYITAIAANGAVTCAADTVGISGVTAGNGLTGGGTSGSVSLAVDTSRIQSRVTGTCATGQYITAISANGAVTCAADTVGISGVTAGNGLTGGGASGSVTVGIASLGVVSGMIGAGAVTAGKIAADAVGSAEIAANAVGSSEIMNSAVTTAKILDGAVTMAKTSAPIGTGAVNITGYSTNGSQDVFPQPPVDFVPDSDGNCFVTAWAQSDSNSNAPFTLEPVLLNVNTNASFYPNAMVPSTSPNFGSYQATSTAVIGVSAGVTSRFGCHLATNGWYLRTPACRVSWVCN